jgi:hypothetical protein
MQCGVSIEKFLTDRNMQAVTKLGTSEKRGWKRQSCGRGRGGAGTSEAENEIGCIGYWRVRGLHMI